MWATITVSVQDRPDPVSNLLPTGFADRADHDALESRPVQQLADHELQGERDSRRRAPLISTKDCPGTTCTVSTPGNGPSNSVRISVVATNGIGDSDAFTMTDGRLVGRHPAGADRARLRTARSRPAPVVERGHNAVRRLAGGDLPRRRRRRHGGCAARLVLRRHVHRRHRRTRSLANGVAVSWTVSPRNGAYTALSVWNTSEPRSDVPAGPPIALSSPLATVQNATTISLDWAGVFSDNGRPITEYTAAAYTGAAPTCAADGSITGNGAAVQAVGGATSTSFGGLSANATYSLIVFAFNGQGCTASPPVVAHTPPERHHGAHLLGGRAEHAEHVGLPDHGRRHGRRPAHRRLLDLLPAQRRQRLGRRVRPGDGRVVPHGRRPAVRQRHLGAGPRVPQLRQRAGLPDRVVGAHSRRHAGHAARSAT